MPNPKILIVDDDPDLIRGLSMRLRAAGFDVAHASDGVMAIPAARREKPALVLLDLGLPGGDGFKVMERLRTLNETATTPIVVLTARDQESDHERARTLGADTVLVKPADNEMLIASIRKALRLPA